MTKIKYLSSIPDDPGVISTKYADITTIKFLPDNIKAHDIDGIKKLITEYGFVEPIGINRETGHDIFGNGRLEVLLQMLENGEACPKGIVEKVSKGTGRPKTSDVRQWFAPIVDGLSFSSDDEIILAAGMNRTNEKGGIDHQKALDVLTRLRELDPENLVRVGYSDKDLDHIRQLASFHRRLNESKETPAAASEGTDDQTDSSRESYVQALNSKWQVAYGDTWMIGRHILKCMDAADQSSPVWTATSHPVRLCFTSPPYDNQRSYENDADTKWTPMMIGVTQTMFSILSDPGDIIVNLGPVYRDSKYIEYWRGWLNYSERVLDQPVYGVYIWDKLAGYPGNYHGRLSQSHEFLYHFSVGHEQANKWIPTTGLAIKRGPIGHDMRKKDGSVKKFTSPDTIGQAFKIPDSVIRLPAEMSRGIHTQGHPATFPVELAEYVINTWTQMGDRVFDPFGGTGTTMLACQNLDRTCLMTEISPNYCALILERMSQTFPDLKIFKYGVDNAKTN